MKFHAAEDLLLDQARESAGRAEHMSVQFFGHMFFNTYGSILVSKLRNAGDITDKELQISEAECALMDEARSKGRGNVGSSETQNSVFSISVNSHVR